MTSTTDTTPGSYGRHYGQLVLGRLKQTVPRLQPPANYKPKATRSSQKHKPQQEDTLELSTKPCAKSHSQKAQAWQEKLLPPEDLVRKALCNIPGIHHLDPDLWRPLVLSSLPSSQPHKTKAAQPKDEPPKYFALSSIGEAALNRRTESAAPATKKRKESLDAEEPDAEETNKKKKPKTSASGKKLTKPKPTKP